MEKNSDHVMWIQGWNEYYLRYWEYIGWTNQVWQSPEVVTEVSVVSSELSSAWTSDFPHFYLIVMVVVERVVERWGRTPPAPVGDAGSVSPVNTVHVKWCDHTAIITTNPHTRLSIAGITVIQIFPTNRRPLTNHYEFRKILLRNTG